MPGFDKSHPDKEQVIRLHLNLATYSPVLVRTNSTYKELQYITVTSISS